MSIDRATLLRRPRFNAHLMGVAALALVLGLWVVFQATAGQGGDPEPIPEDPCVVFYGPAGCARLIL